MENKSLAQIAEQIRVLRSAVESDERPTITFLPQEDNYLIVQVMYTDLIATFEENGEWDVWSIPFSAGIGGIGPLTDTDIKELECLKQ